VLLIVENQPCIFTSLSQFRDLYRLPRRFCGALFSPEQAISGLVLDAAGVEALQQIANDLLAALPAYKPRHGWYPFTITLQKAFRRQLIAHRLCIPLTPNELEGAVYVLGEVTRAYIYTCLQAGLQHHMLPDFDEVYGEWLSRHLMPAEQVYTLTMPGEVWEIRPLYDPLGLFGLRIETECGVHHVYEDSLRSPMVEFLDMLLRTMTERFGRIIFRP
jgi:hypothetical protein